MAEKPESAGTESLEIEQEAALRARHRAGTVRWDLDVAVFFFAVLTIVVILLFQGVGPEVVTPVAAVGLALGWLMGWRKGRQYYDVFYREELMKLRRESGKPDDAALAATVEEKVQEAMRQRWQKL
jgi:hypothetical protein